MGYTKEQRAAKAANAAAIEVVVPTVAAVLGGTAEYYAPERIEQRAEGKLVATPGVSMIKDEWYQKESERKQAAVDATMKQTSVEVQK